MREIEQLEMEKRNVVEQFAQHKASVRVFLCVCVWLVAIVMFFIFALLNC